METWVDYTYLPGMQVTLILRSANYCIPKIFKRILCLWEMPHYYTKFNLLRTLIPWWTRQTAPGTGSCIFPLGRPPCSCPGGRPTSWRAYGQSCKRCCWRSPVKSWADAQDRETWTVAHMKIKHISIWLISNLDSTAWQVIVSTLNYGNFKLNRYCTTKSMNYCTVIHVLRVLWD